MILVHRLKGEPFVVNADLIASVETTPDTMLRLIDGRTAHVRETPEEIIDAVIAFRAAVLRACDHDHDRAHHEHTREEAQVTRLAVLPQGDDEA